MYYRFYLIFIIFSLVSFSRSQAQNDSIKINYTGSNVTFPEFVEEIERASTIKFYFDPQWVDSVLVSAHFNNISIGQALKQILVKRNLHYYLDSRGNIIITKSVIQTELKNKWSNDNSINTIVKSDNYAPNTIDKYISNDDKNRIEEISLGTKSNKVTATITGYIRDQETGEPLIGSIIFIEGSTSGTLSDAAGFYMLNIRCGTYKIGFRTLGMTTIYKKVNVYSDGQLNINLLKDPVGLKEVVIRENKFNNVKINQMGLEKLTVKEIKELPYAMGERDILKASLFLPGIQTVGEASAGINVRGGAADQNLFIMNNVPIFNTSHMLGMFSAFNADLIKDFKLYKSNIPIEFGGRISSVFEIRSKQGNRNDFSIKGGISPITGKLLIEGPLIKNKSSFIIGIRSTYANWILRRIDNPDIKNSNIYFDDITVNLTHEINKKNQLSIFGYFSIDNYTLASNINYNFSNAGTSLNWKHVFNTKLYSNTSAVYSNYHFMETNKLLPDYKYRYKHQLKYFEINQSYYYLPVSNHELKFGFNSILYQVNPGAFDPIDSQSHYQQKTFENEKALESAIYIGDNYEINPKLNASGGIRLSLYNYLGEKTLFSYLKNNPLSDQTVIDTTFYPNFKSIKSYTGIDFRFSLRYLINDDNSVKVGFSHNNQYLFMLSNTISISPTDKWKLCDPFSKPIVGDQYNIGYYRSINKNNFDVSCEMYYKENKNVSDYKNGADLAKNEYIERDIISGSGRDYGIEFMLKKNNGKLSGWINYSYSRSEFKFMGNTESETINKGNYYPSNYDKPHNINLVINYRNFRRISISANFVYSTGRPYTAPTFQYIVHDHVIINYSERNQLRIPDYYRVDLSLNLDGNLLRNKIAHSSWSVTIYNLTGKRNAYSVFSHVRDGKIQSYMVSIFSLPVFSVSYNFKSGNYFSN
jgi:hypothetical protein